MAVLPKIDSTTVGAIYAAYEAANEHWDSLGISVGLVGTPCDRALWYFFRWISKPETATGRKISIFRTGDRWEDVLVNDLERTGVEVWAQQERIRLVGGHVRGKIDGRAIGVKEAPKTEHLCEFKSHNDASFKDVVKKGCKDSKPTHYAQCQIGMHATGTTRCLYLCVNKNDDARYSERIKYDAEFCLRELARCKRLIETASPPSRISENPEFFGCLLCSHKPVCHHDAWPRVTCRSCLHATPEHGGNGHWSCARWSKPISFDEQKQACPTHLHIPGLVPGEQIDVDEENETVTYKLKNGEIWIDGISSK